MVTSFKTEIINKCQMYLWFALWMREDPAALYTYRWMSRKMKLHCRSQSLPCIATWIEGHWILWTGDFPWSMVLNSFYLCIIHICSPFSWILFFNTVNSQLRTYTSKVTRYFHILRITDPHILTESESITLELTSNSFYKYIYVCIYIYTYIYFSKKSVLKANMQNVTQCEGQSLY